MKPTTSLWLKNEDRPIRFGAEYHFPVIFWPKLSYAAVARSLCDSWACYNYK